MTVHLPLKAKTTNYITNLVFLKCRYFSAVSQFEICVESSRGWWYFQQNAGARFIGLADGKFLQSANLRRDYRLNLLSNCDTPHFDWLHAVFSSACL
ncbi:MAG: hypothetical protein FWG81_08140 [Betaproteobacteria bacterium]|nr:hypothetical protein [Betaproteobacteria bacterium]